MFRTLSILFIFLLLNVSSVSSSNFNYGSGYAAKSVLASQSLINAMDKIDNIDNHIYVLDGDGECDEGLIWESLMSASHYNLTNLTLIVDFNNLHSDGYT